MKKLTSLRSLSQNLLTPEEKKSIAGGSTSNCDSPDWYCPNPPSGCWRRECASDCVYDCENGPSLLV